MMDTTWCVHVDSKSRRRARTSIFLVYRPRQAFELPFVSYSKRLSSHRLRALLSKLIFRNVISGVSVCFRGIRFSVVFDSERKTKNASYSRPPGVRFLNRTKRQTNVSFLHVIGYRGANDGRVLRRDIVWAGRQFRMCRCTRCCF